MRVLFPLDVPTCDPINPYVLQLMDALINQREVSNVGFGCATLYWPKPHWDVIHVQWPEALVGWKTPTAAQVDTLCARLKQARNHAALVVTVHNYKPAETIGPIGPQLYECVFELADAFVHLGQRSVEWFFAENQHQKWCTAAIHEVIEHGDYSYYDLLEQDDTLVPRVNPSDIIYLVHGTMRQQAEITLAENAFSLAKLPSAKLIFAGPVQADAKSSTKRLSSSNLIRYHHRISPTQIKSLVCASDFVFLPRSGRLNSGVLALAFTYDVPVIGPNEGVIGELIEAVDNISFEPADEKSAANSLREAYFLSDEEYQSMCNRVREYRMKYMQWPNLAHRHVVLYERARRRFS